jgi:hypothetical protein
MFSYPLEAGARNAESITYFAIPKKGKNTAYQQTMGMWMRIDANAVVFQSHFFAP